MKSIAEQLKAIQGIMTRESDIPDYRFKFGIHAGRTLEYLAEHHRDYLKQVYSDDVRLPNRVIDYIEEHIVYED